MRGVNSCTATKILKAAFGPANSRPPMQKLQ
jgi:hypothetical protein